MTQIQQFYKSLQQHRGSETTPTLLDMPGLTAELRQYQCHAVSWMLAKEGVASVEGTGGGEKRLHVLWRKLPVQEPLESYFNPYTSRYGEVQKILQLIKHNSKYFPSA